MNQVPLSADLPPHLSLVTAAETFRADCETPVSLYLKLARDQLGFILESAVQGQFSGRVSFIGWDPLLRVTYQPEELRLEGCWTRSYETQSPLPLIRSLMNHIDMGDAEHLDHRKIGLVGHVGFDAIRLVENIGPWPEGDFPWIDLMLPRNLIVFDHLEHTVTLLCHHPLAESATTARAFAEQRLKKLVRTIRSLSVSSSLVTVDCEPVSVDKWQSNMSRDEFLDMVRRTKGHIVDGDIFQVVLSRAVRRDYFGDPFEIYRVLRQINPSPYMFYLQQPERVIVGGSPESLVTLEDGMLSTKPIAGTRPRGRNLDEDAQLEKELLNDEKEIAEHVMLVDLGRNDLGRIAEIGSVNVSRFMQIERYSHVMHIVSVVQAMLRGNAHPLDALMSVFPAGTLSGAPKIRAMQIIDEFEPESRGVYGGAITFFDLSGNLDSCIAIRTAVVEDGQVRVQAGAGLVADSVPETEFEETRHKMMSMVSAVEKALALQKHDQ